MVYLKIQSAHLEKQKTQVKSWVNRYQLIGAWEMQLKSEISHFETHTEHWDIEDFLQNCP